MDDSSSRRAHAKALTGYGYTYEACIEALIKSNDDLTIAAAALVKSFGSPIEKGTEEQKSSHPEALAEADIGAAKSSASNETLGDTSSSSVAQNHIPVNSGTPLNRPLSHSVSHPPAPLTFAAPSLSRKGTISASVEGKTSDINLASLTDAAEAVISSVDAVLGSSVSSKKRAKLEPSSTAGAEADDVVLAEEGEGVVIYASTLDGAFLQLKRLSVMLSAAILESSAPPMANVAINLEDGDDHQPVALAATTCLAANVPTTTVISLVSSLQRYVSNARENKGLLLNLLNAGVDSSSSASASALSHSGLSSVFCGLEAAYCAVLLMSAPGLDRRVISEQLLSDVIKLTRFQVSANIVPCYDAFDSFWRSAGLGESVPSSGRGVGKGKQPKKQSAKKMTSKDDDGEDLDLESDFDISSEAEDDDEEPSGKADAKVTVAASSSASASKSGGVLRATPKLMASALSLMRPILLQLCRLVEQLGSLVENVPNLSSGMVSSLEELSLLASTQTSGRREEPSAPKRSRKTSSNALISIGSSSGHGVEGALQLAAMALLQAVFERYIPSRRQVLADLVAAQVKITGGKKARRDFIAISQLTKPHLAGAEVGGISASTVASSTVSMAKKAALEAKAVFDPTLPGGSEFQGKTTRVSACTALALHLIHSAATLPTAEEIQKISIAISLPIEVKSEAASGGGRKSLTKQTPLSSTSSLAVGAAPENDAISVSVKQTPKVSDKSMIVVATSATNSKQGKGRGRKRGAGAVIEETAEAEEARSVLTAAAEADGADQRPPTTPAVSPPIPPLTITSSGIKPTQQPSNGFQACRSLCQIYVQGIVSWCDRRLKGETTTASTASDIEDPKFVLRRFADDLLNLLDMPEWPAAELMLNYLTFELVNRMSETGGGVSTPLAVSSVSLVPGSASSKGSKNMASLAVLILGTIVSRIQLCRSYAKKHVIELPPPLPERPAGSVPHDEGETVACICGKTETQEGVFHISCDSCFTWFHGACVGIIEGEFEESDKWFCDNCRMRSQLQIQSERAAAFADKMKTSRGDSIQESIEGEKQSSGGGGKKKKKTSKVLVLSAELETGSAVLVASPLLLLPSSSGGVTPGLTAVDDFDTVCKQLLLNYVTELGHLDLFARSGRHFLIARWASESLQARNRDLVLYFSSFWAMPERALLRERRANIVLSSFNTSRMHLQVSHVCKKYLYGFRVLREDKSSQKPV